MKWSNDDIVQYLRDELGWRKWYSKHKVFRVGENHVLPENELYIGTLRFFPNLEYDVSSVTYEADNVFKGTYAKNTGVTSITLNSFEDVFGGYTADRIIINNNSHFYLDGFGQNKASLRTYGVYFRCTKDIILVSRFFDYQGWTNLSYVNNEYAFTPHPSFGDYDYNSVYTLENIGNGWYHLEAKGEYDKYYGLNFGFVEGGQIDLCYPAVFHSTEYSTKPRFSYTSGALVSTTLDSNISEPYSRFVIAKSLSNQRGSASFYGHKFVRIE